MQKQFSFFALLLISFDFGVQAQNTFPATGSVGIGTTTPQQRFHVEGTSNQAIFVNTSALGATSGSGQIGYAKALPTASGNRLGYFLVGSRGGANNNYNTAGMVGYAGGAWSAGSSHPTYLAFETTPTGSTARVERLRIAANGFVGVGTPSPANELHVVGRGQFTNGVTVNEGGVYAKTTVSAGNGLEGYGPFNGNGVYGNGGQDGVYGTGLNGVHGLGFIGLLGEDKQNGGYGVWAKSSRIGVYAKADSINGFGAWGVLGVYAEATGSNSIGVEGSAGGGGSLGVYGTAGYCGVMGEGNTYGVYGNSAFGYAGYFQGNVYTTGSYQPSARQLKQNIKDLSGAMAILSKLQPKEYEYKQEGTYKQMHLPQGIRYGLIAEDLEQALPSLVKATEFSPQPAKRPAEYESRQALTTQKAQEAEKIAFKAVNYTELIPIMIKGMQEQQAQLQAKEESIAKLQEENAAIKQALAELRTLITGKNGAPSFRTSGAYLEQGSPNPARGTTTIRYSVPRAATSAGLTLTNAQGQLLKTVGIAGHGTGQLTLDTASLPAGVYTYSLLIDGQQTGSKQLVVVK